jgi:hypothetical protein
MSTLGRRDNLDIHEIVRDKDHILTEINHVRLFADAKLMGSELKPFHSAPTISLRQIGKVAWLTQAVILP